MSVIYPRGVYIVHQLQKISRSFTTLVVPPFFYAYWKRAEERGGPANAEPHQKKGRKKSTAYEKPFEPSIRVCKKKTCLRARWMWLCRKKGRKKLMIFVVARWPSGSVEEKRRKWNRHRLHGSQWTALRQIRINDQATFLSTSFCILIAHPRNMRRVTVGSGSERVSFIVDFDFASRDHMSKGGMAWTSVARLLEGRIPQFDSSVCN